MSSPVALILLQHSEEQKEGPIIMISILQRKDKEAKCTARGHLAGLCSKTFCSTQSNRAGFHLSSRCSCNLGAYRWIVRRRKGGEGCRSGDFKDRATVNRYEGSLYGE